MLALRVPGGLSKGPTNGTPGEFQGCAHAFSLIFTVLCEGRSRFVETKQQVASEFAEKHNGFDNFFLQDASGPPVVALASQSSSQMPPRGSPDASQRPPKMPPRCFPEASQMHQHQMPSRCCLDAPQMPPRCFPEAFYTDMITQP